MKFDLTFLTSLFGGAKTQKPEDVKKERVNKLIADTSNPLGEEHRESLMSVNDKMLDMISIVNEMSHDEISGQLWDFVNAMDNAEFTHWVHRVYDNYFVYRVSRKNYQTGASLPSLLYKRSFTVDETNNKVTIQDDVVEVVEKIEYVPVAPTTANTNLNKETAMSKDQVIQGLIACDRNSFTEEDRTWLANLSECQLKKLEITNFNPETPAAAPAPAIIVNNVVVDAPKTTEEYLKAMPKEVADPIRDLISLGQTAKTDLITRITANKECPFTKEELEKRDLVELQKIANLSGVKVEPIANYAGQVGSRSNANADDLGEFNVPDIPTSLEVAKK